MSPFTGHGFILWVFFWALFGWFLIPAYIVIGLAWILIGYPISLLVIAFRDRRRALTEDSSNGK